MTEQNTNQPPPSAPPQGQMYFPPQYYAPEDEINLRELFGVLWKDKWWIIGITAIFAVASVFYALSLPNEYKATAIVSSANESGGGGLSKMASQLGGLASLAGVNLGSSATTDDVIAMEVMKTWGFIDEFIKKHKLQVAIFASEGWDQSENKLIINPDIYDTAQKKWLLESKGNNLAGPSSWMLFQKFNNGLTIVKNNDSGLILIEFKHYSPEIAKNITDWLIEDINLLMKEKAQYKAKVNINYLEDQIAKTSLAEMRSIFYSLIQEQTKVIMLANVNDEYVFEYVSNAKIPEMKSGPARAKICVAITFLGLLLGFFLVVIRHLFLEVE